MSPFAAIATVDGSPPCEANCALYLPSAENSSTRLFFASATHTSPFGAIAIPPGCENWPLPEPAIPALQLLVHVSASALPLLTPQPKALTKVPVDESSSTRLLAESATQTLPLESTATSVAPLNWPAPEPAIPAWQLLVHVSACAFPLLTPQPKALVKLGAAAVVNVASWPSVVPA